MAKRTYKILRFDGGINNDADPRDIGDNQFADLQNVAVDEMGKIIVLGDCSDSKTSFKDITGNLSVNGRGFFAFSTDYKGLVGDTSNSHPKIYYLVEDNGDVRGEQASPSTVEADVISTAGAIGTPTFYSADGILRVGDANHDTPIAPRWKGYIKRVLIGGEDPAPQYGHNYNIGASGWSEQPAGISGCFPETPISGVHSEADAGVSSVNVGTNLIMGDVYSSTYTTQKTLFSFSNESVDTRTGPTDKNASPTASAMYWGFAMGAHSVENGTGTWMPTAETSYHFYATTMYDSHTQESLPQLFSMYSDVALSTGGLGNGWLNEDVVTAYKFSDGITFGTSGENVAVTLSPYIKYGDNTNVATASIGNYTFGNPAGVAAGTGNPRISGIKIYWASSEDGFSTLWQVFDLYFNKGIKAIGSAGTSVAGGGYVKMDSSLSFPHSGANYHYQHVHGNGINTGTLSGTPGTNLQGFMFDNPPRYFQYDVLNGHPHDDKIEVDSFKTAVVANRRVYIGNVQQDGIIKEDRMLKSPVNQFDKFPEVNNIDVAVNDGDAIVHLIEYADRIIQFKKNTVYIINISGASEFLEAEHKFKGISNPGAACRMDYGVAWVNQNGCYLYDGQSVTDLLEDQGMRKLNLSDWSDFIGSNANEIIGFHPKKRQLIVKGDSSTVFVYDMVTKSWTKGTSAICTDHSNFINSPEDGRLLVFDDGDNDIDDWEDTPVGSKAIIIKTKDIDFGEPAVRKKLYKVRISYKGNASAVTVHYIPNGSTTDAHTFNGSTTPLISAGTTNWEHAELTPTTSSYANNKYSFQLRFLGTAATDFQINDITLIYRTKGIR